MRASPSLCAEAYFCLAFCFFEFILSAVEVAMEKEKRKKRSTFPLAKLVTI